MCQAVASERGRKKKKKKKEKKADQLLSSDSRSETWR